MDFQGKTVTVIGAAKSGQSAGRLLRSLGARVKISEAGPENLVDDTFRAWAGREEIVFEFDGHTRNFIRDSDLLVLSPGVRIDALPVQWAKEKGVPVWGEIELACRQCSKPVIAVTGSNGKTTVSTLISLLIEASGKKACLCGNVGTPFTEYVLQSGSYDYFVTEISSFQLETIESFKPMAAVFLNFSQNHLDRHRDLNEYYTAKMRIFENQDNKDFAVLNAKDDWVKQAASKVQSRVCFFNDGEFLTEGIVNPNHLAALAVARVLGLPFDVCLNVLKNFKGVEHRMEKVRIIDGVEYINDSKATTVEAGRWALESVSVPVVMISGGRDKNLDFSVLRPLLKQKVRTMIVYGEARAKLAAAFRDSVEVSECETLAQAVQISRRLARPGDAAMLVPMCTSYDQFKNFEERGRAFKTIVQNLK